MIHPASFSDRFRIIAMLKEAHAHHGFNDPYGLTGFVFPFDAAYVERMVMRHIVEPSALCIVSEREKVDGVLMARAFDHEMGPVRVAKDTVWWIDAGSRGGPTAVRMLEAYEDWARKQSCLFVGMAGIGADPDIASLMLRRGYVAAETHYLLKA